MDEFTSFQADYTVSDKRYVKIPVWRQLVREEGESAAILFQYYVSKTGRNQRKQLITDETAANYLGWHVSKVQRYRQKLMRDGWLFIDVKVSKVTGKEYCYYLGKNTVKKVRAGEPVDFVEEGVAA